MKYQMPMRLVLTDQMKERISEVLDSGQYTSGKYVTEFERAYKEHFQLSGECVAVNSCQSGLMLVLKALGSPDKQTSVLLPDFTFSATANAAYWAGCKIATMDSDISTFNAVLPKSINNGLDCVMATHIFGNPCDCDILHEECEKNGLALIYDAAHAHGAEFGGRPIGNFGLASVFSLSPTKGVTSMEGGVVVTQDHSFAEAIRIMRNYGTETHYQQYLPGLNARMSEVHAIIGLESLRQFDSSFRHRLSLVEEYLAHFPAECCQTANPRGLHAWKDFSVVLGKSVLKVQEALEKQGIETKRYFRPISDLYSYRDLEKQLIAHKLYGSIMQLPLHARMKVEDVQKVCKIVGSVA